MAFFIRIGFLLVVGLSACTSTNMIVLDQDPVNGDQVLAMMQQPRLRVRPSFSGTGWTPSILRLTYHRILDLEGTERVVIEGVLSTQVGKPVLLDSFYILTDLGLWALPLTLDRSEVAVESNSWTSTSTNVSTTETSTKGSSQGDESRKSDDKKTTETNVETVTTQGLSQSSYSIHTFQVQGDAEVIRWLAESKEITFILYQGRERLEATLIGLNRNKLLEWANQSI